MASEAFAVTLVNVSSSPPQPPPLPRFPGIGANGPLRRSRQQRVVAGVAGGIAEYLGIDVAIVRIALVVGTLTMGFPMLLYPVAMIVIPKAPSDRSPDGSAATVAGRPAHRSSLGAVVLIAVGVMLLLDHIGLRLRGDLLWPLALIGIGAAVLWSRRQGDDRANAQRTPAASGPVSSPVSSTMSSTATTFAATGSAPGYGALGVDDELEHPFSALERNPVVQRAYERPVPGAADATLPITPAPRSTRSFYARSGFAFFALTVGLAALALRAGGFHPSATRAMSYALLWLGALLFLGAFLGRPRLSLVGALLAGVLVVSSAVQIDLRGGIGERFVTPLSAQELEPRYRLGLGSMQLDLSKASLTRSTTVQADVGIGELVVTVPDGVRVTTEVDARLGSATLFGEQYDGTVHEQITSAATSSAVTAPEGVTLRLDLGVGVGEVVVQRASARIRGANRGNDNRTANNGTVNNSTVNNSTVNNGTVNSPTVNSADAPGVRAGATS